ncbi:MAG: hypothetical protein ACI8PZ_000429 [Myxococcota bacterium]
MSRCLVPLVLGLAACGSNWNIGLNDELVVDCLDERFYYLDVDGDGWGDPATTGRQRCEPEGDLTATNQRDCDDDDASITGRVGAICPGQLVASADGSDVEFGAAVAGEGEFVWVYGSTPTRTYQEARDACEKWAQHPFPANDNAQFGLATFDPSTDSLTEVQQAIVESIIDTPGGGTFAAWIGVQWEGDLESGGWSWEDDSSDGLIDDLGFCTGEAVRPEDFFPNMYINDPEHRELILDELDQLRLALILNDAGGWCLGLPDQIGGDGGNGYSLTRAHLLCERPPADPSEYEPEVGTTTDG